MIFSEIYGSYFRTVSAILTKAVNGTLSEKELYETVRENAFGESLISIPAKLKDGSWPLITPDYKTPLRHSPEMPLSVLEKQWLKALLLDARIRLFDVSDEGLEDVQPLFTPEQFVYYDRYSDGDDFTSPEYAEHFRTVLRSLRERRKLHVCFLSRRGVSQERVCIPYRLEYSSKDDKFRLIAGLQGLPLTINISRIVSAELLEKYSEDEELPLRERKKELVMELYDSRNALERAMLHFSDLEKETERIDEKHYRIKLRYRRDDETELLIRILAFGPVLKVSEPQTIVRQIRERLEKQLAFCPVKDDSSAV